MKKTIFLITSTILTIFLLFEIYSYNADSRKVYTEVTLSEVNAVTDKEFILKDFYFLPFESDNNRTAIALYTDETDSIATIALEIGNIAKFNKEFVENNKILVKRSSSTYFITTYQGKQLFGAKKTPRNIEIFGEDSFDGPSRETVLEYIPYPTGLLHIVKIVLLALFILILGVMLFIESRGNREEKPLEGDGIRFRYCKPMKSIYANIATIAIICSIIAMIHYFNIGVIMLIISILSLCSIVIIENIFKNLKGAFLFQANGFLFRSMGKEIYHEYRDVREIIRESYEEQKQIVSISYSQSNFNQYRIMLKGQKQLILRVASHEEKAFEQAIHSLNKKIYGMNKLGVSFTSRHKINEEQQKLLDEQYEREMPVHNYSLVTAINRLLEKCGLELTDLTEEED